MTASVFNFSTDAEQEGIKKSGRDVKLTLCDEADPPVLDRKIVYCMKAVRSFMVVSILSALF